jgi:2-oxoglutarate ferredoxin oxidoreductase subunit beta
MKGFRYIEVLSPCPINYGRRNKLREVDDIAKWFVQSSIIRNGANPSEVQIEKGKPLILGNFIKRENKLSYHEQLEELEERVKKAAEAKR